MAALPHLARATWVAHRSEAEKSLLRLRPDLPGKGFTEECSWAGKYWYCKTGGVSWCYPLESRSI